MKKLILAFTLTFLVFSCSSTQSGSGTTASKPKKNMLKGTWEVTQVSFDGSSQVIKANLFDIAESACFKGSQWTLVSNNGTGKFTLNNSSGCDGSTHRIHWSFYDSGDGGNYFQFKFVNEKNKPIDAANRGYRAKIENLTGGQSFVLRVSITYNGQPFDVLLSFAKISDNVSLYN